MRRRSWNNAARKRPQAPSRLAHLNEVAARSQGIEYRLARLPMNMERRKL